MYGVLYFNLLPKLETLIQVIFRHKYLSVEGSFMLIHNYQYAKSMSKQVVVLIRQALFKSTTLTAVFCHLINLCTTPTE